MTFYLKTINLLTDITETQHIYRVNLVSYTYVSGIMILRF